MSTDLEARNAALSKLASDLEARGAALAKADSKIKAGQLELQLRAQQLAHQEAALVSLRPHMEG